MFAVIQSIPKAQPVANCMHLTDPYRTKRSKHAAQKAMSKYSTTNKMKNTSIKTFVFHLILFVSSILLAGFKPKDQLIRFVEL